MGPEHPNLAMSPNNLAGLYKAQGKYAEAEPLFKRALAIVERSQGSNHPHVAFVLIMVPPVHPFVFGVAR